VITRTAHLRKAEVRRPEGNEMSIESKATEMQDDIESRVRSIGKGKYGRVLKMARTPGWDEYKKVVTITGIGIGIIGAVGFAIMLIMNALLG